MGKVVFILGIIITLFGLTLMFGWRIPFLGRLPGDIFIHRSGFTFYFPIVTCIIISIALTVVLGLILWHWH
jgi:choline-glycine betaine transporter